MAVVAASRLAFLEWQLPGSARFARLGDDDFDLAYEAELNAAVDALLDGGASTVLLLTPVPPSPDLPVGEQVIRRAQTDRYRQLVGEVASRPGVEVVDLMSWVDKMGPERHRELFPDGVHASQEAAELIWREILAPAIPPIR